jgi:hypothetical protein
MSYEPESFEPERPAMAGRTSPPGIFLIVVGILNVLAGLGCGGCAVFFMSVPDELIEQGFKQQPPENRKAMEEQGIGPQQLRNIYVFGGGIPGVLGVITGPLILIGGIQMCRVRGYAMGVFASVLALLFGCCILGQAAGIWALVVLVNPDVKAAFR